MKKDIVTAAFVIIGDEILSGRTVDKNLNFLAQELSNFGVNLREVRVVPDVTSEIIKAVHEVKDKYDYIFTSGGIGPTHDDITSDAMARAFGTKLIKHEVAEKILHDYYGDEINEARMKMAYIPLGATLLDNPVSSAPGFRIHNVFVMAGVPKIFRAMLAAAMKEMVGGKKTESKEIKTELVESLIAQDFETLQKKYPQVSMGSYPFDGGSSLVFRSIDYDALEKSYHEMVEIVARIKSNLGK